MRRAIAREEEDRRTKDRFASTLVIAASIIAAVRLARADIDTTPKGVAVISDSIRLARMILKGVLEARALLPEVNLIDGAGPE